MGPAAHPQAYPTNCSVLFQGLYHIAQYLMRGCIFLVAVNREGKSSERPVKFASHLRLDFTSALHAFERCRKSEKRQKKEAGGSSRLGVQAHPHLRFLKIMHIGALVHEFNGVLSWWNICLHAYTWSPVSDFPCAACAPCLLPSTMCPCPWHVF